MVNDKKSLMQSAIDFVMGNPKAHQPAVKMNRKQRRTAIALNRKKNVAAQRRKHEGRRK